MAQLTTGYRYLRATGLPAHVAQRVRLAIRDCMEDSDKIDLSSICLSHTGPSVSFRLMLSNGETLAVGTEY